MDRGCAHAWHFFSTAHYTFFYIEQACLRPGTIIQIHSKHCSICHAVHPYLFLLGKNTQNTDLSTIHHMPGCLATLQWDQTWMLLYCSATCEGFFYYISVKNQCHLWHVSTMDSIKMVSLPLLFLCIQKVFGTEIPREGISSSFILSTDSGKERTENHRQKLADTDFSPIKIITHTSGSVTQ